MTNRLNPYLNFDGRAAAAMEFYRSVFGGDLKVRTFGEFGVPGDPEHVMHSQLETPLGFTLMAADVMPDMSLHTGNNVIISISGEDEEELTRYWNGLAEGAEIITPFERQMWGDIFGELRDRFGIPWSVDVVKNVGEHGG